MRIQTPNSIKIYDMAKRCLGTSLSGTEPALGCAITVNNLFQKALGKPVGGGYSTQAMYPFLKDLKRFYKVEVPLPGDVIISPTGSGHLAHGHVGIMAYEGILSNNSDTGLLSEHWVRLSDWIQHYASEGGMIVEFYRVL